MNKILAILSGVIAAGFFFLISKGVALAIVDFLKDSEGVVLASEIIYITHIFPVLIAVIAGYIVYRLNKADD